MASSRKSNEAHWWASELHYGNIFAGTSMDVQKRIIRWLLHAGLRDDTEAARSACRRGCMQAQHQRHAKLRGV